MSHEETYEIYLLSLIMADVTLPVMTGAMFVSCRKHVMFLCTMGTRTTHMDLRKIASLCTHVSKIRWKNFGEIRCEWCASIIRWFPILSVDAQASSLGLHHKLSSIIQHYSWTSKTVSVTILRLRYTGHKTLEFAAIWRGWQLKKILSLSSAVKTPCSVFQNSFEEFWFSHNWI